MHVQNTNLELKPLESIIRRFFNKCEDFVLHDIDITSVEKILKNLDAVKSSGIDQISAEFLKDDAPVIAIHLANIINLFTKLDTFPSQCKIAKIEHLFKKGIKNKAKNYRLIFLLPFRIKRKITFKEMSYCTVTTQVLEQIIPPIHVCLN